MHEPSLARPVWESIIARDLRIDLGAAGDITTEAVIGPDVMTRATLVVRAAGCLSGLEIGTSAFNMLDESVDVALRRSDGEHVIAGTVAAVISGPARAILGAERTALNMIGHLSGIATATSEIVALLGGTSARVAETRKTTPGLRALEKYAVRCGGGTNHRFGLDDAVMIKDNHIAVAGGVGPAIDAVKASVGHTVTIEVEVDRLDQLGEVLERGVDVVLLDNMSLDELARGVELVAGRAVVEASGGITAETARSVAETGVDVISMGSLTHSSPNLDVALDVDLTSS